MDIQRVGVRNVKGKEYRETGIGKSRVRSAERVGVSKFERKEYRGTGLYIILGN